MPWAPVQLKPGVDTQLTPAANMAGVSQSQLVRFKEREKTSFKRFKITKEDWRNREKWGAYEGAVCDMVDRTSTDVAPWHLIEANDKKWARVRVLETIGDAIENALRE